MRQIMLAQCDFDFHTGVGIIAQHLDNTSDRLSMFAGLLQNFQHDHLTGFGYARFAGGDQDVLGDAAVFRHHKLDAMLFKQAPDHAIIGALQHLDDLALRASAPVHAALPHHHHIAVQHLVHFLLAEEHVGAAILRDQEAETVRMPLHLALDQVKLVRHANGAFAIAQDLPVAFHRAQTACK